MPVKAPFRFARINRWIYEPAWAGLVSHDVPFADGLSGEAEVEITAMSSILVGGDRRRATGKRQGEVQPFRLPDGTWAIPGSTLQGMARAILEIAGFGRLGPWVQDRKFGIRDLSPTPTAEAHYRRRLSEKHGKRVTMKSKAGWLIGGKENRPCIVPCKYARIHLDDVWSLRETLIGGNRSPQACVLYDKTDAGERYGWFLERLGEDTGKLIQKFDIGPSKWYKHNRERIEIEYARCVYASREGVPGTLVLTGKPQGSIKEECNRKTIELGSGHKKFEFVFHSPNRDRVEDGDKSSLAISDDAWAAFELLHDEQPGRPINPNWAFWKDEYENGEPVPVFYWEEGGKVETFGMAFAFKAAHTASTYDLLANSCPGHVDTVEGMKLDLPHLIFGVAAEHGGGRGLRRRARFGLARADGAPNERRPGNPSVLLGPKPGYAGIYVRQRYDNQPVPRDEPMATYTPYTPPGRSQPHLACPELSGVKVWPARHQGEERFNPGPVPRNLAQNSRIQTDLVTLPPGTVFRSRLAFHNLRPVELGALLWALSFGDPAAFGDEPGQVTKRHRLGMGKPLGLGEVAIRVTGLQAEPVGCPEGVSSIKPSNAAELASAFEMHMEHAEAYGPDWCRSVQVQALLEAATPRFTSNLEYMVLDAGKRINEFEDAKRAGRYLPDYAPHGSHEKSRNSRPRRRTVPPSGPPAPEPALAVGATVRVSPQAREGLRNREAVVIRIGDGPYPQCTVRFTDDNREMLLMAALLVVEKPPPC